MKTVYCVYLEKENQEPCMLSVFSTEKKAQEYINKLNGEAEGKGFDLKSAEKYKGQADLVVMSQSLEHFLFDPRSILK